MLLGRIVSCLFNGKDQKQKKTTGGRKYFGWRFCMMHSPTNKSMIYKQTFQDQVSIHAYQEGSKRTYICHTIEFVQ